ncbi:MAG: hypothetical protein C0425_11325 [Chlorobiaceae bacterium]|nr:hypothetical protein [Chlorobiaceae bacterium]
MSEIKKHTNKLNIDIDLNLCFYRFVNTNKNLNQCQKIILCKLFSWLNKKDPRYGFSYGNKQWVRNSYSSWQKKIEIYSKSTIRRALSKLEQENLISSRTFKEGKRFCGGEQVKYFTLNFEVLENLIHTSKGLEINDLKVKKESREGIQNEHPHLSYKTSKLKKSLKKNYSVSNTSTTQQDGKFKLERFEEDQIQKIVSMKQIWNLVVEGKEEILVLNEISKREQAYLHQALSQYFSNDVDIWKRFCTKVTTSSFLMGEKTSFKVSLTWILKFSNLQKVIDGVLYGLGDRSPQPFKNLDQNQERPLVCDLNQDALMDGFTQELMIKEALNFRQSILQKVGEGAYISWFSKARLILNDQKKYVLCVENSFIKNSIKNRFDLHLKGLVDDICVMNEIPLLASSVDCAETVIEKNEESYSLLTQNKSCCLDYFLIEEYERLQIEDNGFVQKLDQTILNEEKNYLVSDSKQDEVEDFFIQYLNIRKYIVQRKGEEYSIWCSKICPLLKENQMHKKNVDILFFTSILDKHSVLMNSTNFDDTVAAIDLL